MTSLRIWTSWSLKTGEFFSSWFVVRVGVATVMNDDSAEAAEVVVGRTDDDNGDDEFANVSLIAELE